MDKIYRVQMNSKGMPNFSTAVEIADRPKREWIPCSERLPSEQGQYLVTFLLCNGDPWVYVLSFCKGKFYETDDEWGDVEYDDVTAWMPLPEPYTADRKTENSSEIPNNCEVKNYCDDCLYTDTCDSKEFFYACTSKATISKMEQVDEPQAERSE